MTTVWQVATWIVAVVTASVVLGAVWAVMDWWLRQQRWPIFEPRKDDPYEERDRVLLDRARLDITARTGSPVSPVSIVPIGNSRLDRPRGPRPVSTHGGR